MISSRTTLLRVAGEGRYADISLTRLMHGQSQQKVIAKVVVKVVRVVIAAKLTVNEVVKVFCLI